MMTDERPIQSDRRLLVQANFDRLGLGDVGAWITARRSEHESWGRMSRMLWDLTGLEVSYETLRRWHNDDEQIHASDT
jgi:hypothetical protein